MCGLCGIAGSIYMDERKMFKELLYLSALRGLDSTGVLVAGWDTTIKKEVQPAAAFIRTHGSTLDKTGLHLMMGHCRDATVGTVNQVNAHPYDTGKLISAMNGTAWDFRGGGKTDSENMFIAMETKGIKPVLDTINNQDGYAVEIYEKESGLLHFARNKKRPLFLAIDPEHKVIFWASEVEMVRMVANRFKRKVEIYDLDPLILYTCNPDKIDKETTFANLFEQEKLEEVEGWGNWEQWGGYKSGGYSVKNDPAWKEDPPGSGKYKFIGNRQKQTSNIDSTPPWKDNVLDPGLFDDDYHECIICNKEIKNLMGLAPTIVNNVPYYTCSSCEQDVVAEIEKKKEERKVG